MLKKIVYIAFIVLTFLSCKKENQTINNSIDYSYFPLKVGNYIMYDVTEINIDKAISVYDTVTYQLKEYVESEFEGANGKTQYRLERYIRANDTIPWEIKDVWAIYFLNNKLVKVEENIPIIKINFPVEIDKSWDGNKLNTQDSVLYTITNVDASDTVNSMSFDSVLTVTIYDEESLIDKKLVFNKYAKNIGLIDKTIIDINSQPTNGDPIDITVPIEERITTGTIYTQKVFEYNVLNN